MDLSSQIFSDIVIHNKYARYIPELQRRETWAEIVERNAAMHIRKFPQLKREIQEVYKHFVMPKLVLPSMRSLQFGGAAIEQNNARVYNCAFQRVDGIHSFGEAMFLLLGGTGYGYSVQRHHVDQLPVVEQPKGEQPFVVPDSIEGWGDAINALINAYMANEPRPLFDYSKIREKGSLIVTSGGKAPGSEPLRKALIMVESVLRLRIGQKLRPIDAHDILCHIAEAVRSGGIRRAAMIALFSKDDMEMLTCKSGPWWEENPQRGRANNSVVLERATTTEQEFKAIWDIIKNSGAGEPGYYWTDDVEYGTNPCCEISLDSNQFCNLTEINAGAVHTQQELEDASYAGAFIGTLQAGYTDFHFLNSRWKEVTERDALIGVGMTGIASGGALNLDLRAGAKVVLDTNERIAGAIGINKAARTTTVKPSGTSSIVLGTSSGIHAWHNDYYIRRMRLGKSEAVAQYMSKHHPDITKQDLSDPNGVVVEIPQKAPEGAILRNESPLELLERVRKFNTEWVRPGHRSGPNTNNVSNTASIKDDEWDCVGDWMWQNRETYNGISVLPYHGGTYMQAPFEDCTKEVYESMMQSLTAVDLSKVVETDDNTDHVGEAACAGGACEIM